MHSAIVGAGRGIVSLQRAIEGHRTFRDGADIEAVFSGDQLVRAVDARKRACHPAELVDTDPSAFKVSLEQARLEDIEPPCGVGRRIIGRPFAEMASLGRKNRCWYALDHVIPPDLAREKR